MNTTIGQFANNAQDMARNPLGIIALFLLLVYGIASLIAASLELDNICRYILISFLVVFPFVVLFVFYKLVTLHSNKLYSPRDFRDDKYYLQTLSLGQRQEPQQNIRMSNEIIEEVINRIELHKNDINIKEELKITSLKTLLLPYGLLTIKLLYYTIYNRARVKLDQNIVMTIFDNVQIGGYIASSFKETFNDLENRGIITTQNGDLFTFQVTEYAKQAVIELWEDVFKKEDK